jgi:hypothetical protein
MVRGSPAKSCGFCNVLSPARFEPALDRMRPLQLQATKAAVERPATLDFWRSVERRRFGSERARLSAVSSP